MRIIEIDSIGA